MVHAFIVNNDNINIILKIHFYKEYNIDSYIPNDISSIFYELTVYNGDNIYDIVNDFCSYDGIDMEDCVTLKSYSQRNINSVNVKKTYLFGIVAAPYNEKAPGGTLCSHYLVSTLNYYFADSLNSPIAYLIPALGPDDNATWNTYGVNPNYNTPKLTKLQSISDDYVITIYPETVEGNPLNRQLVVRWILYFLSLQNETITQSSYQYQPTDYVACYSKGICSQFNDQWHKHPLRVIELNWDMIDKVDTNRVRDIDVVYFKPFDRKRTWFDSEGVKNTLNYDSHEYMLKTSFALMNRTLIQMDASLNKQDRLELLSRATYFISLDPATFRSIEAAMVGCLSIVIPIPGVSKTEWASVSYAPEYLQYGIAYGFEDLEHAKATMGNVIPNLREQDRHTREVLVSFIKDIKNYFNLHPDFLIDKLD